MIDTPYVAPKPKVQFRDRINTVVTTKLPPFIDSLIILTISFWYFFFTGLAILFRSPLPKEWLKIGTWLSQGKVAKKIKELSEARNDKPTAKYKVVDLETEKPIIPMWSSPDEKLSL